MKHWLAILAGSAVLALMGNAQPVAPVQVKVLKNNVNLRAKPVPTAEVVGQVSENTVLSVRSMDQEWVEVIPPAPVDLWILSDYIKEGVVICKTKVNVRAGPGINYSIVGRLPPATAVVVRGAHAEWTKVAPPEGCSLWIARSMVEKVPEKTAVAEPVQVETARQETARAEPVSRPSEPGPARPAPSPAPAAAPAAMETAGGVVTSVSPPAAAAGTVTNTPSPLADLDLIPTTGQGQWKQYEGILRSRLFFLRNPSKFRLVRYDSEKNAVMICYVKGNDTQLNALLGRPMVISGREYWVQRQRYPVLVPDRIVLK